jgi:hypothetical protein
MSGLHGDGHLTAVLVPPSGVVAELWRRRLLSDPNQSPFRGSIRISCSETPSRPGDGPGSTYRASCSIASRMAAASSDGGSLVRWTPPALRGTPTGRPNREGFPRAVCALRQMDVTAVNVVPSPATTQRPRSGAICERSRRRADATRRLLLRRLTTRRASRRRGSCERATQRIPASCSAQSHSADLQLHENPPRLSR